MKKKLMEKGMDLLDLPKEVSLDLALITLSGNKSISIENHRGIIAYDESSIKINTKEKILGIEGDNLTLSLLTQEALCISGIIKKVEFI